MKLWDLYRGRDYHIEPTLRRIREAVEYVGNPQSSFPAILVGGTNGKGSTCAFIERILREHGLKTGWFVSPHLVSENERWRINGIPVDDKTLSGYVRDLRGVFERFGLTYFEAAVLIALLYFKDEGIDVAVMEVGMGGRWDATKVCNAEVVVLTNVERDHTRWLGRNVEEIAKDKINLYVKGRPFVIGSSRYPLYTVALDMGIRDLIVAGTDFTYSGRVEGVNTYLLDYSFRDLTISKAKLGLWGRWQVDNAALGITASSLFACLDHGKTISALRETRWEGRMEILRKKPLLIVDGSHNPYAVAKVVKEILRVFDAKILFTGLKDKDWRLSLEIIRRHTDTILLTEVSYHRGESLKELYRTAKILGFKRIELLRSPSEVWSLDEDVVAIGSLYLVGEIKETDKHSVI